MQVNWCATDQFDWVFAAVQLIGLVRVGICQVLAYRRFYALRHLLPLFLPTRLETRTKESNLYASDRVFFKTRTRNECEGSLLRADGGSLV